MLDLPRGSHQSRADNSVQQPSSSAQSISCSAAANSGAQLGAENSDAETSSVNHSHDVEHIVPILPGSDSNTESAHSRGIVSVPGSASETSPLPNQTEAALETGSANSSDSTTSEPLIFIHPGNIHPMQTRGKNGIIVPRLQPTLLLTEIEPSNFRTALADLKWHSAMDEEYQA